MRIEGFKWWINDFPEELKNIISDLRELGVNFQWAHWLRGEWLLLDFSHAYEAHFSWSNNYYNTHVDVPE